MFLVTPQEDLTRMYEVDHYVVTPRGGTYLYYRPWEAEKAFRLLEKIEEKAKEQGKKIKVRLIRKD